MDALPKSKRHMKLILSVALFILLTGSIFFSYWSEEVSKLPPEMPISISPPGSIDTTIQIRVKEPWILEMRFYNDEIPFAIRKKIVGDGTKIVIIPFQWEIYSITTQKLIQSGQIESGKLAGWSRTYSYREVGALYLKPGDYLEPGNYRFVARIPRDVAELADVKARIQIGTFHDGYASWQWKVVFWGSLLSPVLWLIEFVLAVLLIRRIIIDRKVRRQLSK